MNEDKSYITRFNGKRENWSVYKDQLAAYIISTEKYEDLFDIMFPEEPMSVGDTEPIAEPTPTEPIASSEAKSKTEESHVQQERQQETPAPKKLNRLLFGLLYRTISPTAYKYFDNAATGDGMHAWRALLGHFEKDTEIAQISLLEKLIFFPWNETNQDSYDETDFIREFEKHLSLVYKACRDVFPKGIPDLLRRALLIRPLRERPELMPILSHLDMQTNMTFERVKASLLHNRDIINSTVGSNPPQSLYNNSGSEDKNKDKCYICGRKGHNKRACRSKCRHCKRTGHKHDDCFYKPGGKFNLDGKTVYTPKNKKAGDAIFCYDELDPHWGVDVAMPALVHNTRVSDDPYMDSGCSDHLHNNRKLLTQLSPYTKIWRVAKNGTTMVTKESGQLGRISKVNHAEQTKNLLSIGRFVDEGKSVIFHAGGCDTFSDPNGTLAKQLIQKTGSELHAYKVGRLFRLPINSVFISDHQEKNKTTLWHKRLGHPAYNKISRAIRKKQMRGLEGWDQDEASNAEMCQTCGLTQCNKKPFPKVSKSKATKPAEVIALDNCGPISPAGINGERHFTIIQDQYTNMRWGGFVQTRSQTLEVFKNFEKVVLLPKDLKTKVLRTDGAKELVAGEFKAYSDSKGIIRQTTVTECSAQNFAERGIGVVTKIARALLAQANAPLKFWPYATKTAIHLSNFLPTKGNTDGICPYQLWNRMESPPNLSFLRIWGCLVYFLKTNQESVRGQKFKATSIAGAFLGYTFEHKGYVVWNPHTRKAYVRKHVYFDETKPGRFSLNTSHHGMEIASWYGDTAY